MKSKKKNIVMKGLAVYSDKLKLIEDAADINLSNTLKMQLSCDLSFLIMDIRDDPKISTDVLKEYELKAGELSTKLHLSPAKREKRWLLDFFDYYAKFFGVAMAFCTAGIITPIPLLLIQGYEKMFLSKSNNKNLYSVILRQWLADVILAIACIKIEIQGTDYFDNLNQAIVLFSHTSNADAIYVCRSCPTTHYCFAKMELFLVPIFGWLGYAIGGIPVDRGDRDRAINTLNVITQTSPNTGSSICISPEGTRSSTGNLLEFKSGPFHIWNSLKNPIVPMVVFGGYDLYPNKKWVNTSGKVLIKYLEPIFPNEAEDRIAMSKLVRRRMLQALRNPPKDLARELTWTERIRSIRLFISLVLLDVFLIRKCILLFKNTTFSITEILLYLFAIIILITVLLNVYSLFIMPKLYLKKDTSKKNK